MNDKPSITVQLAGGVPITSLPEHAVEVVRVRPGDSTEGLAEKAASGAMIVNETGEPITLAPTKKAPRPAS